MTTVRGGGEGLFYMEVYIKLNFRILFLYFYVAELTMYNPGPTTLK